MQSRLMREKEFASENISLASACIQYSFPCKNGDRNKVQCIGLGMTVPSVVHKDPDDNIV